MKSNQFFSLFLLICLAACTPASPANIPTATIETTTASPEPAKATATPTPTLTPEPTLTATPTETATVINALYSELSPEQLAANKLYGSGFELITNYQGIPVDLTVVTSNAILQQYDETRGCFPNQEMVKNGFPAEDRMAKMVFLGHYVGYLRYSGLTEANYSFEQYTADLKAGADRSYTIWGPRLDGSDGEFRVNPHQPVEYVTINASTDPDGNGRATAKMNDNSIGLGYMQLENGLRMLKHIGKNTDYPNFCLDASTQLRYSLFFLGVPLEQLQGKFQLMLPGKYPTTDNDLHSLYMNLDIYNKSDHKLSPGVLVQ